MLRSKHIAPRLVLWALSVGWLGSAAGCRGGGATGPADTGLRAWDTTLVYDGINPLNPEAMSRAVVSEGSNGRLEAFLWKCRVGGDIRIGFLGGSVTAGAAASSPELRYSSRMCYFLGKIFPKAKIIEVNAGIGGTDSRFGASRVQDDLLASKPDLIVIEYAVNDDPTDTVMYPPALEGVVRQCLKSGDAAVMLYFTLNSAGDPVGESTKIPTGLHYGLPMVSLLRAAWPYVSAGKIPSDSLVKDQVHPTDLGHFIGGYGLFSCLRRIAEQGASRPISAIPAPRLGNLYDTAGLYHAGDASFAILGSGAWTAQAREQGRQGFALTAGAPLAFKYRGRELTLGYHVSDQGDGLLAVSVDGIPFDTLSNNFPFGLNGGLMRLRQVHLTQAPATVTVELRLLQGTEFVIDYLMYAGPAPLP